MIFPKQAVSSTNSNWRLRDTKRCETGLCKGLRTGLRVWRQFGFVAWLLWFSFTSTSAYAVETSQPSTAQAQSERALDDELQALKKDVLELNRDLYILKEELLFPANTQVAIFLSLDVGEFFDLDAVGVKLNGKEVASHLYTERQLDALVRGGVQRLYLGNLKSGEHNVVAVFTGRGPEGRDYRRAASLDFVKNPEAKYLELKIVDSTQLRQPAFSIREWQ